MYDYILFLDIESSDMPGRWNAPTAKVDEWPLILQIAWVVTKSNGEFVKRESFYVRQTDLEMEDISSRLGGISPELIEEKWEDGKIVMNLLSSDFQLYSPLIVGHFMEFIERVLAAEFQREELIRNFEDLPRFCTMLITRKSTNFFSSLKYMGLNELYESLFDKRLEQFHRADADVEAIKDCFFELARRGRITDEIIANQKLQAPRRWELPIEVVVVIAIAVGVYLVFALFFYFRI